MARAKEWHEEDRQRAMQWVENKAKTGAVFRGQAVSVEDELETLQAISDPETLAEHLHESLTAEAWKRLLTALRQRKHADKATDQTEDEAAADTPGDCQSCAALRTENRTLKEMLSEVQASYQLSCTQMIRVSGVVEGLRRELKEEKDYAETMQDHIDWLTEILNEHGLLDDEGNPIDSVTVTQPETGTAQRTEAGPEVQVVTDSDRPASAQTRAAELRAAGRSLRQIAETLNDEGVPTLSGKGRWYAPSVSTLLAA